MHLIGNQYFRGVKTNDTMHDLTAMYIQTLTCANEMFENDVNKQGNFRFAPRPPKMNDLQIIALSIVSESTGIDSETLLFSKLKTNYRDQFPELIDRTRFNRRRRALQCYILEFTKRMSMTIGIKSSIDLVDSVPCPVLKNSRERTYRICKESFETAPRKGFSAVDQRYYIGYKLHLLTNEFGVFQDMQITPANVHDINFLKHLEPEVYSQGKTILGDRAYISASVQTDLFTNFDIQLSVPYRSNQKRQIPRGRVLSRKRRRIEVQFAQLCDQF